MTGLGRFVRWLDIGWVDVVLALGLSALAVLMGPGSENSEASPAVLLCTAPLLVRKKWPIPVLLIALLGFSIAGNASNLAALAGGLTAAVSVGLDWKHPIVGAVAALVVATAIAFEFGHGTQTQLPIPPFLAPFLMIGAAFLAGRAISQRQRQLMLERDRADQIQRDHEREVLAAAEAERRHIARELHDVIAHSVGVMVVQAGAARHVMDDKPEAARESLAAVEQSGHEAMAELRRLLGVLNEDGEAAPLSPEPRLDRLDALITRIKDAGLPLELSVEGNPRPLSPGLEVAAYRILQEALTNALKYAGGAPTRAVLRYSESAIDVEVADEGKVSAPSAGRGRGLAGMRERVALFGGTIDAGPRPSGGYSVRAHLPTGEIA
ncbi:MAG TPA: histidine kinase [Candidatus Dormibacteraeota bacterium]|nr:histidine kinase [Candidatus Dormibacteraeota bacterium]